MTERVVQGLEPRYRLMTVEIEFLDRLLREGTAATKPVNVPADIKILGVMDYWRDGRHLVDVIVWSSTFDVVTVGEQSVQWAPVFEAVAA